MPDVLIVGFKWRRQPRSTAALSVSLIQGRQTAAEEGNQAQVPSAMRMAPVTEVVRKGPRWRGWTWNVLLFTVSLVFCMEGGARVVFSSNRLFHRIAGFDDSSYRLREIKWHNSHPEWQPYAAYHRTRGWALKPDIKHMTIYDGKILNSNSRGLRGKTEYEYPRVTGRQRIVVLGDSFTFGTEVSDDTTYSSDLQSMLPNSEVLNFGLDGYGHDQMLLYLKEEGVKYHPDVVIRGFAYLDIYRNIWSYFAGPKPKFRLVSGGLQLTNVPVPTFDSVLAYEPWRPKALDCLVILRQKARWTLGENETEARDLTRAILAEIIATTRSIGAVPLFVYMPVAEEIGPLPKGYLYGITAAVSPGIPEREQYLRDVCRHEDIPCLFLRPRFREEAKRGVRLKNEGHWDAAEHQIAADEIKRFLLGNKLIRTGSSPDVGWGDHSGSK